MKKFLKVLGIIVLCLAVLLASLAAWQWKYVKAVIDGLNYDKDKMAEKNVATAEKTISDINDQVSVELRDMTQEEKDKIASGELSQTAVMAQIMAEAMGFTLPFPLPENGEGQNEQNQETTGAPGTEDHPSAQVPPQGNGTPANQGNGGETQPQGAGSQRPQTADNTQTPRPQITNTDAMVANAVTQLYSLQGQYTARLEGLVGRAKAYYNEQKITNPSSAKSNTIAKFSGEVASMEGQCDAQVEALLSQLSAQLTEAGADTSVVGTLRSAYKSEKAAQRAAYVNKYAGK